MWNVLIVNLKKIVYREYQSPRARRTDDYKTRDVGRYQRNASFD
jgi:hypothetical protein